ncbi:hypothetical protein [uncultured Tateyamaria sp.]|uniref:hypothetical protein n=1 Tax=Tateyamaria sp. 1078 TaxID=3417464 RepID=UPI00260D48CD|nr:hypothetical protein [uncultured Tateyamaria sp.]
MTDPADKTDWVDALLDDVGQAEVPDASGDLMARVLADAEAAMPAPGGAPARDGLLRQILAGLGGWPSVGGLVAATAVGFAVGLGALDATGLNALWLGDYATYYDDTLGFSVNGWDFEEG